jgi:hypothetical protein
MPDERMPSLRGLRVLRGEPAFPRLQQPVYSRRNHFRSFSA